MIIFLFFSLCFHHSVPRVINLTPTLRVEKQMQTCHFHLSGLLEIPRADMLSISDGSPPTKASLSTLEMTCDKYGLVPVQVTLPER